MKLELKYMYFRKTIFCDQCKGRGYKTNVYTIGGAKCPYCQGTGFRFKLLGVKRL